MDFLAMEDVETYRSTLERTAVMLRDLIEKNPRQMLTERLGTVERLLEESHGVV